MNSESLAGILDTLGVELTVEKIDALAALIDRRLAQEPIQIRLVCESCGKLHVDEGEFAHKVHHTHACQHCGAVWRPAIVPTTGVRFLPGFKNG